MGTCLIRNSVDYPRNPAPGIQCPAETDGGRILIDLYPGGMVRETYRKSQILVVNSVERNIYGRESIEVADRYAFIPHEFCCRRGCDILLSVREKTPCCGKHCG